MPHFFFWSFRDVQDCPHLTDEKTEAQTSSYLCVVTQPVRIEPELESNSSHRQSLSTGHEGLWPATQGEEEARQTDVQRGQLPGGRAVERTPVIVMNYK